MTVEVTNLGAYGFRAVVADEIGSLVLAATWPPLVPGEGNEADYVAMIEREALLLAGAGV